MELLKGNEFLRSSNVLCLYENDFIILVVELACYKPIFFMPKEYIKVYEVVHGHTAAYATVGKSNNL
jgi:hypothetical protein